MQVEAIVNISSVFARNLHNFPLVLISENDYDIRFTALHTDYRLGDSHHRDTSPALVRELWRRFGREPEFFGVISHKTRI